MMNQMRNRMNMVKLPQHLPEQTKENHDKVNVTASSTDKI
jgi:hypothetical protein